jgi:carbamate kinase
VNRNHKSPDATHNLIVLALGGNAIIEKGDDGNFYTQWERTYRSMEPVVDLIEQGYNFVVTHGNGPQVGSIMLMVDKARGVVPETPLGVADAMTCGSMGYMIEQNLQNIMIRRGIWRNVVTVPVQMLVDSKDPALQDPTKPIGPFYDEAQATQLAEENGWIVKEDSNRGYRRYVASPYPVDLVEKEAIRFLLRENYLCITGGGGGIPVYREKDGTIEGVDSVIDKDLASMRIALTVGAKTLAIVTGVPGVTLDFGTPTERRLDHMTLAEARYYSEKGQFPAGSMGPKIRAAIEFLQADADNRVIITDVDNLKEALAGNAGTTITPF